MLQNTEYQAGPFIKWFWRTSNFNAVAYRRTLDYTGPARLLLIALRAGMFLQIVAALTLLIIWFDRGALGAWQFGLALLLSYPLIWAHLVVIPLALGRLFIIRPRERRHIRQSEKIFREHSAVRLAIAGSYGKTSMKELLLTVLSEGKKVAATPANKNVPISHAHFAKKLAGDEDIVIIEYGEGAPGDIARFAKTTHPTHAVVTGIAPAHLDRYRTVQRAAADIFSVGNFVEASQVYVNAESPFTEDYLKVKAYQPYDQRGALGWAVRDVNITVNTTSFTLIKGNKELHLHSKLIGRHQIGPLSLAAALAELFGLTSKQIEAGIAKTEPFEHRMQPYQLAGAWIIDDTYNGNIEGIRVGTGLLGELSADRKIYITPGLVDQGKEHRHVHEEMGRLIAAARPDVVVLMQNSTTPHIQRGLQAAGYTGELRLEDDPLDFYKNLASFVAAGDIVLMQNDWTDNYA
ncbi:MAG TPA: Mur ligase family protein [Candidatus Saccharimonadales bacterium]